MENEMDTFIMIELISDELSYALSSLNTDWPIALVSEFYVADECEIYDGLLSWIDMINLQLV